MAAVAGIKFIKDSKKNNRYVTIDLKKHSVTVLPLLKKLGAIDDIEDDFDKEWKEGITGNDIWNNVNKTIKNHFEKKLNDINQLFQCL